MGVLSILEQFFEIKQKIQNGTATEEDLLNCRREFYAALSEFIDFRLHAVIIEQEKKYNMEMEIRMEAHEKAMSVMTPVLELDLTDDDPNLLK